jgi:hypothetical protein
MRPEEAHGGRSSHGSSGGFDFNSFGVSIFFAIVGYVATAVQTLRAQQHRNRVERVSEQLQCLYGPLLACVTASKSSYEAMVRQVSRDSRKKSLTEADFRRAVRESPQGIAARAYREWIKTVLLPLSERAAQLVINRADLLEGSDIEPQLMQLVAHVSAYKVILHRWEQGGDEAASAVPYPDAIEAWVLEGFRRLKRRQAGLLGVSSDGSQGSPLMQLIASKL